MLRIVADDFGIYELVNKGIVSLLTAQSINSTSLMSNGDAFDDAIASLRASARIDNIGVHLVMIEEESLTGIKLPPDYRKFFIRYALGLIRMDDLKNELDAQIRRCLSSGITPEFLNSHQHLHLLPGMLDIVIGLAKKYNISYIRTVNEPFDLRKGGLVRNFQLGVLRFLTFVAKKRFDRLGVRTNDFFIGFLNAGKLNEQDILKAQELNKNFPNKIIELGCHPGFEDDVLRERYKNWGRYSWREELDLLLNK